jgi:Cys-tRNA(Pro) deacylase
MAVFSGKPGSGEREMTMARDKTPVTPAIRMLREKKIAFTPYLYEYEEKGGTAVCTRELGVSEHAVVKTLVMEDDAENPLLVLMHGDLQVSTRELARLLGVKTVVPCPPDTANRLTGYLVGGTSPFGTRRAMPVYMEETILELPEIYINGGKRGFLVGMSSRDAEQILKPVLVKVGVAR